MGKQAGGVCSMGKPRTLFDCFLDALLPLVVSE